MYFINYLVKISVYYDSEMLKEERKIPYYKQSFSSFFGTLILIPKNTANFPVFN